MKWNPSQYEKFAAVRLRPALDLLSRIKSEKVASIIDLGCGPGNITPYLRECWPEADYTGVDTSADMLARARADHPDLKWIEADIAEWNPPRPVDILYSNAALQWVPDHLHLIPKLAEQVAPGGIFAG
jgi:trans-aconitate 2-methyltransferase